MLINRPVLYTMYKQHHVSHIMYNKSDDDANKQTCVIYNV